MSTCAVRCLTPLPQTTEILRSNHSHILFKMPSKIHILMNCMPHSLVQLWMKSLRSICVLSLTESFFPLARFTFVRLIFHLHSFSFLLRWSLFMNQNRGFARPFTVSFYLLRVCFTLWSLFCLRQSEVMFTSFSLQLPGATELHFFFEYF